MDGSAMRILQKLVNKKKKRNAVLKKVYKDCACYMKIPVLITVIMTVATNVLGVATADTLANFTDAAFNLNFSVGIENGIMLACCVLFVVIGIPLLGFLSDFIMLKEALRHDVVVFNQYLDKNIEGGEERNTGELQFELEDAPNTLRIQWTDIWGKLIALPCCLGYFLYCIGKIHWIFTWLLLLLALIRMIFPLFFKEKLAEYDREEKKYQAIRRDYESDILTHPHLINTWKIWKGEQKRIDNLFSKYYRTIGYRAAVCRVQAKQIQTLINQVCMVGILLAGATLVSQSVITPGEFASLFVYFTVSETLMNYIWEIIQSYPLMENAAWRVATFYQEKEKNTGEIIKEFKKLEGKSVGFQYGSEKIFDKVNFHINVGEKIRIYGENGSGKTTLVKILCTFLNSYSGIIEINGINFQDICKESWMEKTAFALQNPYIFSTTVKENVFMGNFSASNEKVNDWMKEFGIFHIADREVGPDSELSGGEKQKISIARMFLKKADILILDEPSNYLDEESIQILKKHLLQTHKTVILITHDDKLAGIMNRSIQI